MSCGEPCDNCATRAEHHLCDTCCHAEPDALSRENAELRAEIRDLKARVAELEAHVRKGDRFIGAAECADKAEAERDAALVLVAVLREAMRPIIDALNSHHTAECDDGNADNCVACGGEDADAVSDRLLQAAHAALASTPTPTRAEAEAWLRAGEPVRGALAVPAEPDYSGLCSAPSCEGHCGYVHARGCEAVREYLADHGGEPYRAPSPPDILRRVAERARERIAALAYDAGRPDLCARVRAIDLNVLLDGGE